MCLSLSVRLVTAACVGNYGNLRFGTVTCAKMYESCVAPQFYASTAGYRVGGGPYHLGGPGIRNPDSYILTT